MFDEQIFLLQKWGGISRYFVELIRVFASSPELQVQPVLNFKTTSNQLLLNLSEDLDLGISKSALPKSLKIGSSVLGTGFNFPRVDLIHHTFYSKSFWRNGFKGPHVCTHHDMIPELFGGFELGINPHLSKRWYYEKVDHIYSVSHSASLDLHALWPNLKTPVTVTPHGKPTVQNQPVRRKPGNLIYVGVRGGYKDSTTLLKAFAALPTGLGIKLEFLGGGRFSQYEKDLIHELDISSKVIQRDVTDEELQHAYSYAHAFVFTSKYEGFGLPALEAMQFGCRPVLSRVSALVEVAGSCADYFEPGDFEDLEKVLTSVLRDHPDSNPHKESGLLRAEKFSWQKSATAVASVYQSLA